MAKMSDQILMAAEAARSKANQVLEGKTAEQMEFEVSRRGEYASDYCANAKTRSSQVHDAYVNHFYQVYNERLNALPEVKAANRKRSIDWALASMLRDAEDKLAKFQKNLAENPFYAFEWADGAIEGAAKLDVATRLKNIVEHPEGGHEKAVAYAMEQALRGARWPSHSTSAVSNLAKENQTAAYAEFASQFSIEGR